MTSLYPTFVLVMFIIATSALAIYGLHLYVLLKLFRQRAQAKRCDQRAIVEAFQADTSDEHWPTVTSQIPLYNELDVADRIIRAVAAFDYPAGKHEIQVLDDSTDASRDTVDQTVASLIESGVVINVLRREQRTSYKAGALAAGLRVSTGEFVAVFDADFIPPRDFLRQAIPLIHKSPDIACLQGRWSHLNQDDSWLTRAQALGIDGHFAVEQGARAWNGLMMNFNGTAGIWRKAAIDDPAVGGWNGDTLTEDLDLSYRAQLAGWRIDYCMDLACPAELPGTIDAFKSQQRRWATGSIQVAVKLLPRIWRSPLTIGQRVEATLHLTHYSVALWMLLLALVARPMLLLCLDEKQLSTWFWVLWTVIAFSAVAPPVLYTYARWSLGGGMSGLRLIPWMMALGCGMCVNNALAVVRGLYTRGGEFVRTPKSGSHAQRQRRSSYAAAQSHMWIAEIILGIYSLVSFGHYVRGNHWGVSIFLLLYGVGFCTVGWMSRPRRTRPAPHQESPVSAPVTIAQHAPLAPAQRM